MEYSKCPHCNRSPVFRYAYDARNMQIEYLECYVCEIRSLSEHWNHMVMNIRLSILIRDHNVTFGSCGPLPEKGFDKEMIWCVPDQVTGIEHGPFSDWESAIGSIWELVKKWN